MSTKSNLTRQNVDKPNERNTKKDSYKNRQFAGESTMVDEYTGGTVYYSKNEIINGNEIVHSTLETSNTDHIITVDIMMERYKKAYENGDLTLEQLQILTNADFNLAITNESLNKSKQGMSNSEFLYQQFQKMLSGDPTARKDVLTFNTVYNMLDKQISAEIPSRITASEMRLINAVEKNGINFSRLDQKKLARVNNSISKGTSSGLFSLTASAIDNAVDLINGNKDVATAMDDIVRSTGKSFTSSAGADIIQNSLTGVAKYVPNDTLKNFLIKDLPIQQIATAIQIGSTIVKFVNDDISMEQCVGEIVKNTFETAFFTLATTVGGVAGSIIATVVISQANKFLVEYMQEVTIENDKERRFNQLIGEALIEIESERNKLVHMIEERNTNFDQMVNRGYEKIFVSTLKDDVEGIADGLNEILKVVNETVAFKSMTEYDAHFFSDDIFEF